MLFWTPLGSDSLSRFRKFSPMSLKNDDYKSLIGRQFRLSHLKSNMSCPWGLLILYCAELTDGLFRYLPVTWEGCFCRLITPLPSPCKKKTSWLLSKSLLLSGLSLTKYCPQLPEMYGLANLPRMRKPELKSNPFLTQETRRSSRRGSAVVCNPNFHNLLILNFKNCMLTVKYLNLRN